ncbi:MAG: hypothetical protein QXS25_00780 [Candidatus Nitrosocaldus sp.]
MHSIITTMMNHPLDTILLLYIALLFGINNAGIAVANMLASGFNYRMSVSISTLGFAVGALVEGWKMVSVITLEDYTTTSVVTAIMLSIFSFLHIPVSMVNIIFASYIGSTIESTPNTVSVISWWIIAPFMALTTTILIYHLILRFTTRLSLVNLFRFYSLMLPVLTFYASYTIGANNLGLLYSMGNRYIAVDATTADATTADGICMMLSILLAFTIGMIKGKNISRFLSEEIVGYTPATIMSGISSCSIILWLSTQMHIPLPFSQMLVSSLIGINMIRKPHLYNKRSLFLLVSSWIGSTLLSFIITFVVTRIT